MINPLVRFNPPPGFPPILVSGVAEDPISQFLAFLVLPLLILRGLLGGAEGERPSPFANFTTSFTNEESWEISRGANGRITGVTIHRRAVEE